MGDGARLEHGVGEASQRDLPYRHFIFIFISSYLHDIPCPFPKPIIKSDQDYNNLSIKLIGEASEMRLLQKD